MVFNNYDWAKCGDRIAHAVADGAKRVNFVFTLHFISADGKNDLSGFCYERKDGSCPAIESAATVALYQTKIEACLTAASARNLGITITPHIDDASAQNRWRNNLAFDPFDKTTHGFSYDTTFLTPIANAIEKGVAPGTSVEFALEGEMGATLEHSADHYLAILNRLKDQFKSRPEVKFGISFNFSQVFGENPNPPDAENLRSQNLQKLINAVDFVGLSNYCAVDAPVDPRNFDRGVQSLMDELGARGIQVPKSTALHFTEIGLGGGTGTDERTPSLHPEISGAIPYSGIRGTYVAELDPWKDASMRAYRESYYQALGAFLGNQQLPWKVKRAFLWNADSWDVEGLYLGTYADPIIIDFLKQLRAEARSD